MNWDCMYPIIKASSRRIVSGENHGLKKIGELPMPCLSPAHNPPSHMVYSPWIYEYTCPACGKKITFTVSGPIF